MKNVSASLILVILLAAPSFGQTPAITLITSKTIGTGITFQMKSVLDSTSIQIDFGDGILVNKLIGSSKTKVTGNVAGTKHIKIYGTGITYFDCGFNQLTDLNVTGALSLDTLTSYSNQLTSLDVSKNLLLKQLQCSGNKLSGLDVTQNVSLLSLKCANNKLTDLDVSKNTELTTLACSYNQLSVLNVANNSKLIILSCPKNLLTSLDISRNTQLTELYCDENKLIELDVTKNTALLSLTCSNNVLASLITSNNPLLEILSLDQNGIGLIDVTKNTKLERLFCSYNNLRNLNLSENVDLEYLECIHNQLTVLDFSFNLKLIHLHCRYNTINSLNINFNKALKDFSCDYNKLQGEMDVSEYLLLESFSCSFNNLTTLHVIDRPQLWYFGCSGNRLTFSTIPIITSKNSDDFIGYSPQQNIPIIRSVNVGMSVDLSSQYAVNGNITNYKWKTKSGSLLVKDVDYILNSGKTIFLRPQADSIYCEMTNATFPEFSGSTALKTTCTKVFFLPYINVPADSLTSTCLASIAFFNISSNTNWNITVDKSWLISDITSGINNAMVTLSVMANTEMDDRSAIITISSEGVEPKRITLLQEGIPFQPQLFVSTDTIIIDGSDTTSNFEIFSNLDWQIAIDQDWLQSAVTEGSDSAIIGLTTTKNANINARVANITITVEGIEAGQILVIQQGTPFQPQLDVSTDTITIDASDTTSKFEIFSNLDWNILVSQDWLGVSSLSGFGNSTVILTSSLNSSIHARTALISVSGEDTNAQNITIIQKGAAGFLNIPDTSLTLSANADSTYTIDIISNITWTVMSNQDWLSVNIPSGSGNAQLTVFVQPNASSNSRTANLTFSGPGVSEQIIHVVQNEGLTELSSNMNSTVKVFPNPAKDFIIIENEDSSSEIDELSLIDLQGRVVMTKNALIFNTCKVELQSLKSGTYILQLNKGITYITKKIIVINQ
jgi:hypothetical protein